jgi:hypothetical protein
MRNLILTALLLIFVFPAFSDTEFRATAAASLDFASVPNAKDAISAFASSPDPYYGIGWEVIMGNIGIGGNYLADFTRDANKKWTVSWLAEALFVSYHLFGAGAIFDLFGQAGVGCAGSVYIGSPDISNTGNDVSIQPEPTVLAMSLFPFFSIGTSLKISNVVIGTKLSYVPGLAPVPVTQFDTYPLKNFQVSLFVGPSFVKKKQADTDGDKKDDCNCNS